MAGNTTRMSLIKQLLRLHKESTPKREMARVLGISKNTVKDYLIKLSALGLDIDRLLIMDDIPLEAMFHSGNPSFKPEQRYQELMSEMDYILKELPRTGVTRMILWQEYKLKHPDGYLFTQFCYHVTQRLAVSKPSMVLTHLPGDKLFIDFAGDRLSYCDKSTGEIIKCEVFVASLPASDYCFAIAVESQCTEDFLYALERCLIAIGGVPKAIVSDNLKAAVIKANRYEPELNRAMEDFGNHYGTAIVPARALHPKDKALVENQVKNVYRRVYAPLRNMQFFDLASLNASIFELVMKHNQTRMQLKPYCREEYFLAEERHLLSPLADKRFEIKHYAEYTVTTNNHFKLTQDQHYYSVPYIWIGTRVKVVYTHRMVHIYAKGEQVALHPRIKTVGKYSTVSDHLCSTHKHYQQRSPDYYITKAGKFSSILSDYITAIFGQKTYPEQPTRHPEQLYRQCDGLLALSRKHDRAIFDKACAKALNVEVYSYMFVKNMIDNNAVEMEEPPPAPPAIKHGNIRGRNSYNQ